MPQTASGAGSNTNFFLSFTVKKSRVMTENRKLDIGLVVCGPCACGKSEVASALGEHFDVPFVDADSYHSKENIEKMSSGIPLTDEDRLPWLVTVRKELILQRQRPTDTDHPLVSVVGACSALKKKYRNILSGAVEFGASTRDVNLGEEIFLIFVFLNCSESVLQKRLEKRERHFMKPNMLASQLETLEVPDVESETNSAIIVNGDAELNLVVKESIEKVQALVDKKFRSV